jgi:hypothetical protein
LYGKLHKDKLLVESEYVLKEAKVEGGVYGREEAKVVRG